MSVCSQWVLWVPQWVEKHPRRWQTTANKATSRNLRNACCSSKSKRVLRNLRLIQIRASKQTSSILFSGFQVSEQTMTDFFLRAFLPSSHLMGMTKGRTKNDPSDLFFGLSTADNNNSNYYNPKQPKTTADSQQARQTNRSELVNCFGHQRFFLLSEIWLASENERNQESHWEFN